MKNETTLDDVLEAVNTGFTQVQVQIHGLDGRVQGLEWKVQGLDQKIDDLKVELKADIAVLTEHVDGFALKQLEFEAELAAERSVRERLEQRIR